MADNIVAVFEETVRRRSQSPGARFRDGERWVTRSWSEIDDERKRLASGLIALGLQPTDRVNILANTSYKWVLADLAVLSAGGISVPIYPSNLAHECEYIINDSEAAYVFVEDKSQLDKLKKEQAKLTRLRKVIVLDGATDGSEWTLAWSDLMELGRAKLAENGKLISERTAAAGRNDPLVIIYTSGTTGRPKGVVLTHGNQLYELEAALKIEMINPEDVELLFLPLAHSFARVLVTFWLGIGHEMAFDSDISRITANMAAVRPTVMASVPRVFEKMYSKVVSGGLEAPGLKGKLFKWALETSDADAEARIEGRAVPIALAVQLKLAKRLVFGKIQLKLSETFGGRMRYFISGGAPLPKKMAYFFANAGVSILEGYGLTETSAATTVNRPTRNKLGTVGPAMPGSEVRIAPDGEILLRGPGVMREYWKNPDATREVLSPDGWFSTGDIGEVDADGYVKITDRKKDIIVTAGGKNVAPQNIESLIKSSSSLISQVMVHGDKRNYLVALITLDADQAKKLAADKGMNPSDYAAVAKSSAVAVEMDALMKRVNAHLASYETIKKFKVLEKDFEIGEELTPTLKVKRKFCNEKYRGILDAFYEERVE